MANIREYRDKDGKLISYTIRVYRGRDIDGNQLKSWTTTFDVLPTWTEKSARKKAEAFAATFEKSCRQGTATDSRLRFDEYCEYVLDLKESRGTAKHSTLVRYRELTARIYPAIGHFKLREIRADHLNDLYTQLCKTGNGAAKGHAVSKVDFPALLKAHSITRKELADKAGIAINAVYAAVKGESVSMKTASAIAAALNLDIEKIFTVTEEKRTLSTKTVLEYHRLIHVVLEQAVKEGLVPFNAADRATLPKAAHKDVNYYQPEEIAAIRDALETEPIKWKTLVHLFLITGARRGEILGLKWEAVDFTRKKLHICNSVLYNSDIGVYESTPKTSKSDRYIVIPDETVALLRRYKAWQAEERLRLGAYYDNQGFVFAQDNGKPLHPDSVNVWLNKFSKRHDLPHINPHAFRHSMASMLYFNGVDSVSISKRLGHAQVSTTANIYAHVIEEADERNADIIAEVFLRKA